MVWKLVCDSARGLRRAETPRLEEFEIPSEAGSECRLSAADDDRIEKQVTFVDETGFEGKPRKFGAANVDVVLRFPLELPIASRSKSRSTRALPVVMSVSVREKTIFSAFCQTRAKSRCPDG